jgi:hypothetical protein
MLPPSSGSKSKTNKETSMKQAASRFLLGLFFDSEDGGDMVL